MQRDSTSRYVGPLVGRSVGRSPFWAAAPKGTKSCRTQGTFVHSFVCPFVRLFVPPDLSGLKSALSGLKSSLSGLKSALSGLESVRADLRPKRADFRSERADSRPERVDFRPERAWGGWVDG